MNQSELAHMTIASIENRSNYTIEKFDARQFFREFFIKISA